MWVAAQNIEFCWIKNALSQTGAQRPLIHDSEAHDSAEGVAARHPGDSIFPLALHVPGDVVPACVEFSQM